MLFTKIAIFICYLDPTTSNFNYPKRYKNKQNLNKELQYVRSKYKFRKKNKQNISTKNNECYGIENYIIYKFLFFKKILF